MEDRKYTLLLVGQHTRRVGCRGVGISEGGVGCRLPTELTETRRLSHSRLHPHSCDRPLSVAPPISMEATPSAPDLVVLAVSCSAVMLWDFLDFLDSRQHLHRTALVRRGWLIGVCAPTRRACGVLQTYGTCAHVMWGWHNSIGPLSYVSMAR